MKDHAEKNCVKEDTEMVDEQVTKEQLEDQKATYSKEIERMKTLLMDQQIVVDESTQTSEQILVQLISHMQAMKSQKMATETENNISSESKDKQLQQSELVMSKMKTIDTQRANQVKNLQEKLNNVQQ